MKPPPFWYHRPDSRAEVDALLHELGTGARVLAGGQSLIPMMNMRLAAPTNLVDLNFLKEEATEPVRRDGGIVVGPLVRTAALEGLVGDGPVAVLLSEASRLVAHVAIRNRGTVAGSVAHADPAAELPAVLVLLGGTVRARSTAGSRDVRADDLFVGPLETSLRPGEWIDEVRFPLPAEPAGASVAEFSRRRGDFAVCGVAATAHRAHGAGVRIDLCFFAVDGRPLLVHLEPMSDRASAGEMEARLAEALGDAIDPHDDHHASAEFRRHLAHRLGVRVARKAVERLPPSGSAGGRDAIL